MKKIFISLFIFFFATPMALAEELKFVTGATEPMVTDRGDGYLNILYENMFKRLGYSISIQSLPPLRALNGANAGNFDGDLQRIAGLENKFSNLIQVPEKMNEYDFVAFSKKSLENGFAFSRLRGLKVGYLRGWKFYETNIPKDASVIVVDKPEQLLLLLKHGRIDVALYSKWEGYYWANKIDLEVFAAVPPLKTMDMYLYVHKKHGPLVEAIAKTLKEMKHDNTYEQIRKENLYILSPQLLSQR